MATKHQRPKGRDAVLSSLNMAIDALNLAKELSSITPAKAVFGSVGILLTMIKVRSLLFRDETFRAHAQPGHDGQRSGLRRRRAVLRRYLQGPRPGDERKEAGRSQPVGMRRNKSADDVSKAIGTHLEPFRPRYSRLQDGRGNTEEDHEAERAARGLAISAREERQGGDCGLEVRPQRDPQCLQRVSSTLLRGRC